MQQSPENRRTKIALIFHQILKTLHYKKSMANSPKMLCTWNSEG